MLFTTATFAFVYLPLLLLGFFAVARVSHIAAAWWVFAGSVFFYGYWMPQFTLLLLGSITVNFFVGMRIAQARRHGAEHRQVGTRWLIVGIAFNLVLLGYFKYANFLVDTVSALLGLQLAVAKVLLPIGISFFTFTQIAFLADAYQKGISEYKFTHYGLFVTYFPHLIAGPVLHHSQMMPQFQRAETYRFQFANFAAGLAIFGVGLFKKIVVADGVSPYANAIFDGAAAGAIPSFVEAWTGSLAYTFQLYFDFSGYSDMAIGLSWLLNVQLPYNFNSPYKALNISDFWRRWHMSLSTFLRDYLYIPLGGSRHGPVRRYRNLAATMLLGGLWHGASWTFVFWGGLHGAYLAINHAFQASTAGVRRLPAGRLMAHACAWLLTFAAVVVAWVFFRATSFEAAAVVLRGMAAQTSSTSYRLLWNAGLHPQTGLIACAVLAAICVFAPNSNSIGERIRELCTRSLARRAFVCGLALTMVVFLIVLNESRDAVSAFIYFNF